MYDRNKNACGIWIQNQGTVLIIGIRAETFFDDFFSSIFTVFFNFPYVFKFLLFISYMAANLILGALYYR